VASLAVNKNKTGGHAEQQAQILATLAVNKQSWRLRQTTNSNFDDCHINSKWPNMPHDRKLGEFCQTKDSKVVILAFLLHSS
jgi:hypothetical protein